VGCSYQCSYHIKNYNWEILRYLLKNHSKPLHVNINNNSMKSIVENRFIEKSGIVYIAAPSVTFAA
jgi:hypothetical protein